jgi:autotransporter-associated beta strand protein
LTADTSGNYSQTLDGSYKINSLSFTGTNTGTTTGAATNSVTLASGGSGTNTLTLNGANTFTDAASNSYSNTGLVDQAGSAAHTISANINLGNSQSWEIDTANALVVSGTIADGSTADALTKTGNGTLILSASNTYDGGTTVSAGPLKIATSNALLGTGALTVTGAGTFDLSGYNQSISSLSDGGVATGSILASTGTSNLMINGNASSSFGGSIGGAINITQNGSGTLTLSGSNSYTGLTTLNAGSLIAASNAALGNSASATGGLLLNPASGTMTASFTSANPTIASLANSGAGASNIVLGNGPGNTPTNLTITGAGAGAGTTFSGVISDLSASHAAATGSITLLGGSLTLTGANTFAGNTTVNGGALNIGNALALQNSTLNLVSGSAVIGATPTTLTLGGLTGSQNFALTNTAATPAAVALSIGGVAVSTTYTGNLSGLGGVTKNGSGTIQFGSGSTGGASYAGPTAITNGTLILGGTGTITGGVTLSGAGGVNALTVQDTAAINSGSTLYIQTGNGNANPFNCTVLLKNSASVTVAGLSFGQGSRVTGDSLTIQDTATLTDNGFFDFDYNLGGSTNGTPSTHLNGGVLAVQKFQMTAGSSGITNPSFHFNGGTLDALANDTSSTAFFLPAIGGLTADVDSGGAFINSNGFNITIAQALVHGTGTPDGGLAVSGGGSLTLTGTNTYTGPTTINTGATLQLGNGATGNDGTIATSSGITDNGTLIYNRFGSPSSAVAITGAGVVQKIGPGAQTLSATSGYTGATTVSGGTLIVSGALSATASLSVSNGATLELAANNALNAAAPLTLAAGTLQTLANQVQSLGNLTIGTGASTLTLGLTGSILNFADSSTNTWTGTLAITNWNGSRGGSGSDQIFIGSSADLTLAQLADITFTNGTVNGISFASSPATQLADGEIVAAIPEPGTWAMLLSGIGALAVWQRRRGMRIG